MRFNKIYWTAAAIVVTVLAVFIYSYVWGPWSHMESVERISMAQLYFSALGSIGVVFALIYATVQVRKSTARPHLKIVIGEDRVTKTSLTVPLTALEERQSWQEDLILYIYNDGNSVSDLYNIQFELPSVFNPYLETSNEEYGVTSNTGKLSPDSKLVIIPFSTHKLAEYACFVGEYISIGKMCLRITPENKDSYPGYFNIEYRIFGNWADKQEGSLAIIFKIE